MYKESEHPFHQTVLNDLSQGPTEGFVCFPENMVATPNFVLRSYTQTDSLKWTKNKYLSEIPSLR